MFPFRIHNEGWLLDTFQRIQSDEATFFVPFDLEISNQELSYVVKKAEQWRGINGERRKASRIDQKAIQGLFKGKFSFLNMD